MSATPASDSLRSEHRLVEVELDRLLHAVTTPAGDIVGQVRRTLSGIQCLSKTHFQKEETILYPCLRSHAPDLLSQLDAQHEHARELEEHIATLLDSIPGTPDVRQLADLVRSSRELCDVIQHHIVEEEEDLLRLADSLLSYEEQTDLAAQMKALEPLICTDDEIRRGAP